MTVWHVLFDLMLLLGGALVAGGVLARLGQNPLIGYLLAGMLLGGPGGAELLQSEKNIGDIAELGVALLLFSLGLEFSWGRLRALGTRALVAGAVQVAGTLGFAALAAWALGLGPAESIAVGAMLALSSTACVLRVLMERAELDTPHGRSALAVLLVQDIAIVPLAVLMTLLAGGRTGGETMLEVGRIVLLAGGLVLGLFVLVNQVAVRALATLTLARNRELTVLLAVIVGLGAAWAAHQAGVSPALGAFLAGMLLGASKFATQIRSDVASLRTVLLTLFFAAAGMAADPSWIGRHLPLVAGATVALITGKAALTWAALRIFGIPNRVAAAAGITLAQIGEFAFVLIDIGSESGVVSDATGSLVVSVAIVSLFVTPYLAALAPHASAWLFRRAEKTPPADGAPPPDVVIIGFGPAGEGVARALAGASERGLVLDLNEESVGRAEALGLRGEVGDATLLDVLEHARVQEARLVVITIPDFDMAATALHHVHRLAPHVPVVVRSRYQRHSRDLAARGAIAVAGDEEQVALELARRAREQLDGDAAAP